MATIQTLIDDAREDMKIDPGKIIWTDDQLIRYANEAVDLIYNSANFKFGYKDGTITPLVDGTASYAKAADFRKMIWAKLKDGNATSTENDEELLTNVTDTLPQFQMHRDMNDTGDKPAYIYEENDLIYLYPVPNAACAARYTIKYKYSEYPDIMTGVSTPAFPSHWHFIVGHYVRYRAYGAIPGPQNMANAANALQEWREWKQKAVADMLHREGEGMSFKVPVLPRKISK